MPKDIPRRRDRLYKVWYGMKTRCYNENAENYHNYGGRGITMCDEWLNDYDVFKEWALENGYDYSKSRSQQQIDRKDNDGNYCPENCRIVTQKENARNTRLNKPLTYNGETHTMGEWAEMLNVSYAMLRSRVERAEKTGESIEEILFKKKRSTISNTGIRYISQSAKDKGYTVNVKGHYCGWFKTLEEAVKRKEEYLLEISKNITRQNTNQDGRCRVCKRPLK